MKNDAVEQIKAIINQKLKEANNYTDKTLIKNEENLKIFISKEIKYNIDNILKRIDKIES